MQTSYWLILFVVLLIVEIFTIPLLPSDLYLPSCLQCVNVLLYQSLLPDQAFYICLLALLIDESEGGEKGCLDLLGRFCWQLFL